MSYVLFIFLCTDRHGLHPMGTVEWLVLLTFLCSALTCLLFRYATLAECRRGEARLRVGTRGSDGPAHPCMVALGVKMCLSCAGAVCSTLYHLLGCGSQWLYEVLFRADLIGIALLIFGSYVPGIYYAYYCFPTLQCKPPRPEAPRLADPWPVLTPGLADSAVMSHPSFPPWAGRLCFAVRYMIITVTNLVVGLLSGILTDLHCPKQSRIR